MVELTNGVETFTVPEGAVGVYKNMGFRPVTGTPDLKHVDNVENDGFEDEPVDSTGDSYFDELLSKPISQWNQDEIKEFAAAKGYDVSEAKSLKQARQIIKSALDAESMAEMGE